MTAPPPRRSGFLSSPACYDEFSQMGALLLLVAWLAQQPAGPAPVQPAVAAPSDYKIGPQDILKILVLGHDDLAQTAIVQADGNIVFPLLGRIRAAGLTPEGLEADLAARLGAGFIRDPEVDVVVQEYRSQNVFVTGEVAHPGTYPLIGQTSLIDVLSRAGPLSSNAAAEVVIVRSRDGSRVSVMPAAGEADLEILRVNAREILSGNVEKNVLLRPNDSIFVPEAPRAFISGQVKTPGAYPVSPGTTVRQVVILAGGLSEDAGGIRVLREVDGKKKESKIGLDDPVEPGDTLIVKAKLF